MKYRVVQLGDLEEFKVQRWWGGVFGLFARWVDHKEFHHGYGVSYRAAKTFYSLESACHHIEWLKTNEKATAHKNAQKWETRDCHCPGEPE